MHKKRAAPTTLEQSQTKKLEFLSFIVVYVIMKVTIIIIIIYYAITIATFRGIASQGAHGAQAPPF